MKEYIMTDQRIREIMPLALVRMIQKGELHIKQVELACRDNRSKINIIKEFLKQESRSNRNEI